MQKHGDFIGAQFLQQTCKVSNQGSPLSKTSGSQTSGRQHVLIKYTQELQGSEKLLRHCAVGRIRDANSTAAQWKERKKERCVRYHSATKTKKAAGKSYLHYFMGSQSYI